MKRNVTIQLDEEVIVKVKVLATKRRTSIGGLVAAEITRLTEQDERYERAKNEALARMAAPSGYASDREGGEADSGRGWTRDEIYAERTDRWV